MAFTTPKTWSTGNTLTAADLNTYIRDNIAWLATDKPTVQARRSTNQSIPNNVMTDVLFDAEDWDNANVHSTSSNTNRLTVPTAGKYLVGWSCYWQLAAAGRRVMRLTRNGVPIHDVEMSLSASVSSGTASYMDNATAGTWYSLQAFQTSGAALDLSNTSYPFRFWAIWMGT